MARREALADAVAPPALLSGAYAKRSQYLADVLKSIQSSGAGGEIRTGGGLAANLLADAITQYSQSRNDKKEAAAVASEKAATGAQRHADAMQAFPDDPAAQAMYVSDPTAAMGAFWKGREPTTLAPGVTQMQGGKPTYTAPMMGMTEGRGYSMTPEGMTPLGELAPSQPQVWNHENQINTQALDQNKFAYQQQHDPIQDAIARMGAQASMAGAGAAGQNAQTNRMEYEARKAQGGFGTPGGATVAPWQMPWGQ